MKPIHANIPINDVAFSLLLAVDDMYLLNSLSIKFIPVLLGNNRCNILKEYNSASPLPLIGGSVDDLFIILGNKLINKHSRQNC